MKKVLLSVSALFMVVSFMPAMVSARAQAYSVTTENRDYDLTHRCDFYSSGGVWYAAIQQSHGQTCPSTYSSSNAPTRVPPVMDNKITKGLALGLKKDMQVLVLQTLLNKWGYLKADATGNYGQMTVTAVRAYQKAKGLPVTGTVGPKTRAAISADMAGGNADASTGTAVSGTSAGKIPPTVQVAH